MARRRAACAHARWRSRRLARTRWSRALGVPGEDVRDGDGGEARAARPHRPRLRPRLHAAAAGRVAVGGGDEVRTATGGGARGTPVVGRAARGDAREPRDFAAASSSGATDKDLYERCRALQVDRRQPPSIRSLPAARRDARAAEERARVGPSSSRRGSTLLGLGARRSPSSSTTSTAAPSSADGGAPARAGFDVVGDADYASPASTQLYDDIVGGAARSASSSRRTALPPSASSASRPTVGVVAECVQRRVQGAQGASASASTWQRFVEHRIQGDVARQPHRGEPARDGDREGGRRAPHHRRTQTLYEQITAWQQTERRRGDVDDGADRRHAGDDRWRVARSGRARARRKIAERGGPRWSAAGRYTLARSSGSAGGSEVSTLASSAERAVGLQRGGRGRRRREDACARAGGAVVDVEELGEDAVVRAGERVRRCRAAPSSTTRVTTARAKGVRAARAARSARLGASIAGADARGAVGVSAPRSAPPDRARLTASARDGDGI